MNKEFGLYTPDGDFRSDREIKRDLAEKGDLPGLIREELTVPASFERRADIMRERSAQAKELSPSPENTIKISLPRTSIISFIGDQHIGHPKTDYNRIQSEVETIANSPDSYVVFLGDAVDGICWGGEGQSEQIGSLDEQHGFLKAMLRKLRGKIIAGFGGEHDSKWTARSGPDALMNFQNDAGAPYVKGIGLISIEINDQTYTVVAGHKLRGHSLYNNTHPEMRASRELQGADIYVGAHNHSKGVSQQAVRSIEGSKVVTNLSVGPYKTGDTWSGREGFPDKNPEEMGGVAIKLWDNKKMIEIADDILEAHKKWM